MTSIILTAGQIAHIGETFAGYVANENVHIDSDQPIELRITNDDTDVGPTLWLSLADDRRLALYVIAGEPGDHLSAPDGSSGTDAYESVFA